MSILLDWLTVEENALKYVHCKTTPGKTMIDMRMELVKGVSEDIHKNWDYKEALARLYKK